MQKTMQRSPRSCLVVLMRTSSLARSHLLCFHHSSCCYSSIGCRHALSCHALSYLLSMDSGQSPQQHLQEARLPFNSKTNSTFFHSRRWQDLFFAKNRFSSHISSSLVSPDVYHNHPFFWRSSFSRNFFTRAKPIQKIEFNNQHSQRAVTIALWCNFLVFSLKLGVWLSTSSHVMLAEAVHSAANFADQAFLAYWLSSSRLAPDALHPYGYSKERLVLSSTSAAVIFCFGYGVTIVHGFQNLWTTMPLDNIQYAALVIGGSFIIKGASLVVVIQAVKNGAAAEGMKLRDYIWRGQDLTSVAVMTEDVAAVTGLIIAGASLLAVNITENAIYDPIGCIVIGYLLGLVPIFLIQRNLHASMRRSMDDNDVEKVLHFLKNDLVVDFLYDCRSEVIGPGFYRFEAEIVLKRLVVVQKNFNKTRCEEWSGQFIEAAKAEDEAAFLNILWNYGEEVDTAAAGEVHRLKKEIQELVPSITHVDINY